MSNKRPANWSDVNRIMDALKESAWLRGNEYEPVRGYVGYLLGLEGGAATLAIPHAPRQQEVLPRVIAQVRICMAQDTGRFVEYDSARTLAGEIAATHGPTGKPKPMIGGEGRSRKRKRDK